MRSEPSKAKLTCCVTTHQSSKTTACLGGWWWEWWWGSCPFWAHTLVNNQNGDCFHWPFVVPWLTLFPSFLPSAVTWIHCVVKAIVIDINQQDDACMPAACFHGNLHMSSVIAKTHIIKLILFFLPFLYFVLCGGKTHWFWLIHTCEYAVYVRKTQQFKC